MSAISSISASVNVAPAEEMNSSVVPSCRPAAVARRRNSSRVANRDGTGLPRWSLWLFDAVLENPSPPASMLSCSSATMASSCAAVAS